jgi:hypothetical protein
MADKRAERIADLIKPLRVKPGSKVNLAKDFDPGYKAKAKARASRVAGDGHQLGQAGQPATTGRN